MSYAKNGRRFPVPVKAAKPAAADKRLRYDCGKCPAYCCTYPLIEVGKRDIARLARHFGISAERARARYTWYHKGEKSYVLRHRKDKVFKSACQFLDPKTRNCGIYDARPSVCREYPDGTQCGYYEFLKFERKHQDDPEFLATT